MITASTEPSFDELTARLAEMARALAEAQAANAALVRRSDPVRWRQASLVWPLFTASLLKKKG